MGLKVRHNGIITDLSGSEYDPGNLGTKRLKIRHSGGITSYGLATDPTATSYCGLKFVISGVTHYIGRKTSASGSQSYTTQGSSTREGHATRSSTYYTQSDVTGTETYQSRTTNTYYNYTYTGYTQNTRYTFSYTGGGVRAASYLYESYGFPETYYYGSSWTRTYSDRWWQRDYSSTNGVKTGGWTTNQGAWGAGVYITSANSLSTTYINARSQAGANQVETGSFVNNRTSIYWHWISSYRTSSAFEVANRTTETIYNAVSPARSLYVHTFLYYDTGTQMTSTATVLDSVPGGEPLGNNVFRFNYYTYRANVTPFSVSSQELTYYGTLNTLQSYIDNLYTYNTYQSGTFGEYASSTRYVNNSTATITHEQSSYSYTQSYYRTETRTTTVQSQVETTRQSNYTYQSDYTYQQTTSSSASTSSHNFV